VDPSLNGSSSSSSSSGINPASVGIKAFNALAGYIFGGNASGTKMAMTTPVFSSTDGSMEFVVAANAEQVGVQASRVVARLAALFWMLHFIGVLNG
jgi:hypothetical protein